MSKNNDTGKESEKITGVYVVEAGSYIEYFKLEFATGSEIKMKGGTLLLSYLIADDDFKISGEGNIIILSELCCGKRAKLILDNIALTLHTDTQNNIAKLIMDSGSYLSLSQYRINGGKIQGIKNPAINPDTKPEDRSLIVAPRQFFFSKNQLEWGFRTDIAYPEWFGSEKYYKTDGTLDFEDWSDAINKCFFDGFTSVVSLDAKRYNVRKTIFVPSRCQLRGTSSGITNPKNDGDESRGTILVASEAHFTDNWIIAVNCNFVIVPDTLTGTVKFKWVTDADFPAPGAVVSDIRINNKNNFKDELQNNATTPTPLFPPLNGILISGAAEIDNVIFNRLLTSIKWLDNYSDMKKVTRCSVYYQYPSKEDAYAIDFGFLGDACIFEGNAIHGDAKGEGKFGVGALRMSHCFGGTIASNIINGNVLINKCKGLKFTANHLEYGVTVHIINSSLSIEDNYFQKGLEPNIQIESGRDGNMSVVNLSGNNYMYLSKTPRVLITPPSKGHLRSYIDYHIDTSNRTEDYSDYDIAIIKPKYDDGGIIQPSAVIKINNEYRYFVRNGSASDMYPAGIKICTRVYKDEYTPEDSPLNTFNNRSWYLSKNSVLNVGNETKVTFPSFTVKDLNNPKLILYSINKNYEWFAGKGKASYCCQAIWDSDSKIKGSFKTVSDKNGEIPEGGFAIGNGLVTFRLENATSECGNSVLMRVWRLMQITDPTKSEGDNNPIKTIISSVDLPMIGGRIYYDNGISLNGYKWKDLAAVKEDNPSEELPESLTYIGDIVIRNGQ